MVNLLPRRSIPVGAPCADDGRPVLKKEAIRQSFDQLVKPVEQELFQVKSIYRENLLSTGTPACSKEIFLDAGQPPCAESELYHELAMDIARYLGSLEGKWLRPALMLLATDFFDVPAERAVRLAAALELIHNATLIHDDLIDASETRRGHTTVWSRWGNPASVLMGDLLCARAFELTTQEGRMEIQQVIAAATLRMCQGELHELQWKGRTDLSETEYLQMVSDKTAALMSACTECGALLAEASPAQTNAMRRYGLMLGMAFQITDDVLDYIADIEELGKTVGNDLANGQVTLPLIHFLSTGGEAEKVRLALTGGNGREKRNLTETLEKSGSIDYALSMARRYAAQAGEILSAIEGSPKKKEHLSRLAGFVVDRRF